MKKRLLSGDGPAHLAYLCLCVPVLIASFLMSTNGTLNTVHIGGAAIPLRLPCLFKFLTGFNCPACGLTRSFIYMSHFNPSTAFRMNHAGILLYALCVFEVPYRLVLLVRGKIPAKRVFAAVEALLFVGFCAVDLFFFVYQFFAFV